MRDRRYVELAKVIARWSKDPSTQVGALLVDPVSDVIVATGYNGFPRKVREVLLPSAASLFPIQPGALDMDRWSRPQKYQWVEHAERNAIYNAARVGQRTAGCVLYFCYQPQICADCARAIIQAGIVRVVGGSEPFPGRGELWAEQDHIAMTMLNEAGVEVITL